MSEPAKMSVSEAQTDDSESETILKEYSDGLGWDGPRTKLRHLESIHKSTFRCLLPSTSNAQTLENKIVKESAESLTQCDTIGNLVLIAKGWNF